MVSYRLGVNHRIVSYINHLFMYRIITVVAVLSLSYSNYSRSIIVSYWGYYRPASYRIQIIVAASYRMRHSHYRARLDSPVVRVLIHKTEEKWGKKKN